MVAKKAEESIDLASALVRAFGTNNRINTYLVEGIPDSVWDAKQPGGKGRTIAAMAAHLHNVRLMWLKAVGAREMPEKLDAENCSKAQAIAALKESGQALEKQIEASLSTGGRVKGFKPDVVSFFGYLMAHDAHHRGQMTMLARQLGAAVPQKIMYGLWEWGTR